MLVDTVKKEGFASVGDNGVTVVLNTALTDELIEEGYVREIISKIQTMRKEADFVAKTCLRCWIAIRTKSAERLLPMNSLSAFPAVM